MVQQGTRRPLVAGNWKMHGSEAQARSRVRMLLAGSAGLTCDVLVAPPCLHIPAVAEILRGSSIGVASQDVSEHPDGAFTGQISAAMLHDAGCAAVIVGHSERRAHAGETDVQVASKFVAARAAQLVPILCVGETLAERDAGVTAAVVIRQLDAVLLRVGAEDFAGAVVAYEPIWAIGTGRNAAPMQAQEVHALLRARLAQQDAGLAAATRIIYGGSVRASNARVLFEMPDIDGGLVGGASLDAREFLEICASAR